MACQTCVTGRGVSLGAAVTQFADWSAASCHAAVAPPCKHLAWTPMMLEQVCHRAYLHHEDRAAVLNQERAHARQHHGKPPGHSTAISS